MVLKRAENSSGNKVRWKCLCDCGSTKILYGMNLRMGRTTSCGCLQRKYLSAGMTTQTKKERLYNIWCSMRKRCQNPKEKSYKNYGGRGITVCKEWDCSFVAFRSWALSHNYDNAKTLDRIDVNGNYTPENCRWVDMAIQNRNKRNNISIAYAGKTMCLFDWAEEVGIGRQTLTYRLKAGWPIDRALTEPVHTEFVSKKNKK